MILRIFFIINLAILSQVLSAPIVDWSCLKPFQFYKLKETYPLAFSQEGTNYQKYLWDLEEKGQLEEAQALESEIKNIMEFGERLKGEDIKMGNGGGRFLTLDMGIIGIFKKRGRSFATNVESEVAAHIIDRIFGFRLTPLTIVREAENGIGSLQLAYKNADLALYVKNKYNPIDKQKLDIFDYLINNTDRHEMNYLVDLEGRIIAIDHGLSLANPRGKYPVPKVDLDFFRTAEGKKIHQNLRSVPDETIRRQLSSYLDDKIINEVIERKNKLIFMIDSN